MGPILSLFSLAIEIYIWIIIVQVVVSWLIVLEVINVKNAKAQNLIALMKKATDPVFTPIRKVIPPIGGIDITPIIVILGLSLIQRALFGGYLY